MKLSALRPPAESPHFPFPSDCLPPSLPRSLRFECDGSHLEGPSQPATVVSSLGQPSPFLWYTHGSKSREKELFFSPPSLFPSLLGTQLVRAQGDEVSVGWTLMATPVSDSWPRDPRALHVLLQKGAEAKSGVREPLLRAGSSLTHAPGAGDLLGDADAGGQLPRVLPASWRTPIGSQAYLRNSQFKRKIKRNTITFLLEWGGLLPQLLAALL